MNVEIYMVERPGGDHGGWYKYTNYRNKAKRLYFDKRGVQAFLRSYPDAKVWLIVGEAYEITEDFKDA